MESDADLIKQVLNGSHDSYATLLARYERLASATVLRILGDQHLAEDVLQESFVAAFGSLSSLRDSSCFGSWLVGIVRRQALRALRRTRQTVVLNQATEETLESTNILPEDSMALLEIVDRLPDDERTLIGLRHFEGFSMSEIAEITGSPLGTVTKKFSRIHKNLKEMLSEEEI